MTKGILVIDDDLRLLKITSKMLDRFLNQSSHEFQIMTALSAQAGEKIINDGISQNFICHVIVCDYKMPEMTGLEFHRKLRRDERWKTMPFILYTSEPFENLETSDYSYDYVPKVPGDYTVLFYTIKKILDKVPK